MLFPKDLRANLTFFGWKFLSGKVFVLVIQFPIHETLITTKVSLLHVAKNFKFGAKIALTSISLSFITHLLLNKTKIKRSCIF